MAKKIEAREGAGGADAPLRLVVLDSHAIIHRAYHALPDFSSSKGEPTGALYGLVSMLLRIAEVLKPDYLVAARDLPGATHRHEMFEAYKATRAKADDDLIAQLERAPAVFEAFGIPLYQHPGYEADDVVGTIVRQVSHRRDLETVIATGDMDALQLVGPRVRVFTLRKGLADTVLYDEEAVRERYGFAPERVTDFKALRGDPSDNIPGVKGVGEKTATELIARFGSVEEIYAALEGGSEEFQGEVKPRVAELLRQGKGDAAFSKTLATIRSDVPIAFALPARQWHLSDHAAAVASLCEELEFPSLRERVAPRAGAARSGSGSPLGESVDPDALREASVALWLLNSDLTNPGLEDILRAARARDFETAREVLFAQLRETGRLREVYEEIERPLIPVVARMNAAGVYLDTAHLGRLAEEYGKELSAIAARIYRHAGHEFNLNSPKQLGAVLYDELKIAPARQKKTAGGQRTTREDELAKLADQHPVIEEVLAYRELQKLLSTYVEKLPARIGADGRLHAEFVQTGTTTGRMSSQHPNLQNIPVKTPLGRRIREAFAAPPGRLLLALDYSQIELRIAAGLSGDEKLIGIFRKGGDVHASVASEVFGVPPEMVDYEMRRRAKVINFGILYGMGVNALRANLGAGVSREEAARFLDEYFKNFSGLARYIERTKADAALHGYTETLFGRRRYFPALRSPLAGLRAQAERMATNAPIQGTQADIIKLAMARADALLADRAWRDPREGGAPRARLVLQVHDELVYEVEEAIAEEAASAIREAMESVVPQGKLAGVPVLAEASSGANWGDMRRLPR